MIKKMSFKILFTVVVAELAKLLCTPPLSLVVIWFIVVKGGPVAVYLRESASTDYGRCT